MITRYLQHGSDGDSDCLWLARSAETEGFDLLDVAGSWQLWVGAIGTTELSVACNECEDDTDCNLNGSCDAMTHECICDEEEGVTYLGYHCEVKLVDECRIIIGEDESEWSIQSEESNEIDSSYGRPVYSYAGGLDEDVGLGLGPGDDVALIYSGARWFTMALQGALDEQYSDYWAWIKSNYHRECMPFFHLDCGVVICKFSLILETCSLCFHPSTAKLSLLDGSVLSRNYITH